MKDPTQSFDFYSRVLNYGNREDCEIMGTDEPDDWYSWEAELADWETDNCSEAVLRVYNTETGHERKFFITWEEIL